MRYINLLTYFTYYNGLDIDTRVCHSSVLINWQWRTGMSRKTANNSSVD